MALRRVQNGDDCRHSPPAFDPVGLKREFPGLADRRLGDIDSAATAVGIRANVHEECAGAAIGASRRAQAAVDVATVRTQQEEGPYPERIAELTKSSRSCF